MTARISLGPRKTYLSVLRSGFSSSRCGDWMDGSMSSLAKSGKGLYLIVQGGRIEDLGESNKVSLHACNYHNQTH